MTRYESKGFGTEKFDVDNEKEEKSGEIEQGHWVDFCFSFFFFFFFYETTK